jgi:hypothetical protein
MRARDYCAHVAAYYDQDAQRLAFSSDQAAYDRAWAKAWAWHRRAEKGILIGAWLGRAA